MAQVEISDPTRSDAAILEKIKTKETKWDKTLFKRMDEDEKHWIGYGFKLRNTNGDELEDVQNGLAVQTGGTSHVEVFEYFAGTT